MNAALSKYALGVENEIPADLMTKRGLLSKAQALWQIHQPATMQEVLDARRTLSYEELFAFQTVLAERAIAHRGKLPAIDVSKAAIPQQKAITIEDFTKTLSPRQKQLLERLPFPLTDDQRAVIAQMNEDIDRNYGFGKAAGMQGQFSMRALL